MPKPNPYGFPQVEDEYMQELNCWYKQLCALLSGVSGVFNTFASERMGPVEIAMSLKQAQRHAHDIEFMCGELYDRYQGALEQERDAEARKKLTTE